MALRQALFAWAFNPAARDTNPSPEIAAALGWAACASLPVTGLEDTATVRLALAACAKTLTGKAAAGSTQRRKRSVPAPAGLGVVLGPHRAVHRDRARSGGPGESHPRATRPGIAETTHHVHRSTFSGRAH
jgi:hypothetical protein